MKIDHIAALARLPLTNEEKKRFEAELGGVLAFVGEIEKVRSKKTRVSATITGLTNVTRDDTPTRGQCLETKQALANAAQTHSDFFKVKAVFDS